MFHIDLSFFYFLVHQIFCVVFLFHSIFIHCCDVIFSFVRVSNDTVLPSRFDEFYFYTQGALLAVDTFGSSHILPVIGLPLLVTAAAVVLSKYSFNEDRFLLLEVAKVSYSCTDLIYSVYDIVF